MSEPDDRELHRRIAELPRSIHPQRDLWADIERRIASPNAVTPLGARKRKIAAAGMASMVAVAAAVALLFARRVERPAWPWPAPTVSAVAVVGTPPPPASSAPPADALDDKERASFRAAVSALETSFAENRHYLSSDAAERVERSLGVLDHAIDATEQALARDPDSAELRLQLWDEYQQKIDALTAVVDLVTRTS